MADFRPGRPGFMMYFDWVESIKRMANSREDGKDWALAMFFAIADYAEDGTLPENPFVDMAISGYTHTIESDSEKYWKQVDGSHKGGQKSAEQRQLKAAAQMNEQATAPADTSSGESRFGSIFVDTQDGLKPLNVPKHDQDAARQFADDVKAGKVPRPQTGGLLLNTLFHDWMSKQ